MKIVINTSTIQIVIIIFCIFVIKIFFSFALDENKPHGIRLDSSLGQNSKDIIKDNNGTYNILQKYGYLSKLNLFHSFSKFNVHSQEKVQFHIEQNSINNVICRVTGNNYSWINGKIIIPKTSEANLYLLNPSGIIFGENAELDISGSFNAVSSHYIRFKDDSKFYSNLTQNSVLSSESPIAFGFLNGDVGKIEINSNGSLLKPILKVDKGKTVSLIGSEVNIQKESSSITKDIIAPSGRIIIAGVKSSGEFIVTPTEIGGESIHTYGSIRLSNYAKISVSGNKSGSIFIQGEKIELSDHSTLEANTKGNEKGGIIDIKANHILLSNFSKIISENRYNPKIIGNFESEGGNVLINALQDIKLINNSKISTFTYARYGYQSNGNAGKIDINAQQIFLNNSKIYSETHRAGKGGDVSLTASDSINFVESEIVSNTDQTGSNAGNISINAKKIFFLKGSGLDAQTKNKGNGGDVNINAEELLVLKDIDDEGYASTIHTSSKGTGNAGDIKVTTKTLLIDNGGGFIASTEDSGTGGLIDINASDSIIIKGNNPYSQKKDNESGIYSTSISDQDNAGIAGNIKIISTDISLLDNAKISTSSKVKGGGLISITSKKLFNMNNAKIATNVFRKIGDAGAININADIITMNNSKISANAYMGKGGDINIASNYFIKSNNTIFENYSELGIDGKIVINTVSTSPENALYPLSDEYIHDSKWLRVPCSNRFGKNVSELVKNTRDGVPKNFDDWLASPIILPEQKKDQQKVIILTNLIFESQILFHQNKKKKSEILLNNAAILLQTNPKLYLYALPELARTFQEIGYHKKALAALCSAVPDDYTDNIIKNNNLCRNTDIFLPDTFLSSFLTNQHDDYAAMAQLYSSFGDLCLSFGQLSHNDIYSKAVNYTDKSKNKLIKASVLNNKANFLVINKKYHDALTTYNQALKTLDKLKNNNIEATIILNITRLQLKINKSNDSKHISNLENAFTNILNQLDSYNKASNLISLSILGFKILNTLNDHNNNNIDSIILDALNKVLQLDDVLQNKRIKSFALGYLGYYYEIKKDFIKALSFTNKAIFIAQSGSHTESQYLWEWQLARLNKQMGYINHSIKFYQRAIETLEPIRNEFFTGYRKQNIFDEVIKPVYLGLTEQLLKLAQIIKHKKNVRKKIIEARDVIERLKAAEIQNFYEDECLIFFKEKLLQMDKLPGVAIIYPIIFKNQLVILLSIYNNIKQYNIPVTSQYLQNITKRFRAQIQNFSDQKFFSKARELYSYLINPIEKELLNNKINTLVIVPDGVIRLIPFAALFNQEKKEFLIEKYSIVTLPSTKLTEQRPCTYNNIPILLGGLSEKANPPLPGVKRELLNIKKLFGKGCVLVDEKFTFDNFLSELKNQYYPYIVIATHGSFGGNVNDSYLMASNGKVSVKLLENLVNKSNNNNNMDLLTLSACQTGVGNDRSAMGLAGVALKAGAKSALATLWSIKDDSTPFFIEEFYRLLKKKVSKAKALQLAQIKVKNTKGFEHPAYWAPFILIGNWL